MKIAAIIVAAGRGNRAGGKIPKQLRLLGSRPIMAWSLAAFSRHAQIGPVILVVPEGEEEEYRARFPGAAAYIPGGESRQASVRNGLSAAIAPGDISHVMIHDAARPGVDEIIIDRLIAALDTHDGAAPALPVADALKRPSGQSVEDVDRTGLFRVQTPQAFRLDVILSALADAPDGMVDDLAVAQHAGARLTLVEGHERLGKVTYPEDFSRMQALLCPPVPRMGSGFDVHAFEPGDHVTLCGIEIAHTARLKGHSDADVGWHALTDAILGALGLGDIGDHFPPSDEQWRGAPSHIFLAEAMRLARAEGFELGNCDLTLICEAPKIKPHREAMRKRTAEVLGVDGARISVKATTTEALGFTGRREGIAAQAIAVLSPKVSSS
ncbi:MAG: bifunctional 2-C-methyl-D-erythritol 4-phosphate cytidylyltransferase/2-C-methyl-D-erythritol 2,4-cyclodiphosphate synthase [Hyphomonadaceae bacterium]|nr:bifunctional 2-C-methyl-D-erythritol 4-phosphate cytidylyltransferase/2-C-methyl-D-erythritol 2,4-cyclodiphosphate synthase [Hyphomonadaceae bacterium]